MNVFFQGLMFLEEEYVDFEVLVEILFEICKLIIYFLENKIYLFVRIEVLFVIELLFKKFEEFKQWECLIFECRVFLIEFLVIMELDSRFELQEKVVLLKKIFENLE